MVNAKKYITLQKLPSKGGDPVREGEAARATQWLFASVYGGANVELMRQLMSQALVRQSRLWPPARRPIWIP